MGRLREHDYWFPLVLLGFLTIALAVSQWPQGAQVFGGPLVGLGAGGVYGTSYETSLTTASGSVLTPGIQFLSQSQLGGIVAVGRDTDFMWVLAMAVAVVATVLWYLGTQPVPRLVGAVVGALAAVAVSWLLGVLTIMEAAAAIWGSLLALGLTALFLAYFGPAGGRKVTKIVGICLVVAGLYMAVAHLMPRGADALLVTVGLGWLAWLERSVLLAAVTTGYLLVMLITPDSSARLLAAAVVLLGGGIATLLSPARRTGGGGQWTMAG